MLAMLQISAIDLPCGGVLGLTHCPGRCGRTHGTRDLVTDFATIAAWGAALLVTLNEGHEFETLGVPDFAAMARVQPFRWYHAPIPDMAAPGAAFAQAWATTGPAIAATLNSGGKVAIHCAAGLGRTGTLAAKLLVDRGLDAAAAIALVRARRPGAIETQAQAAFVLAPER
jgi:protein-tyrosine phosphatase